MSNMEDEIHQLKSITQNIHKTLVEESKHFLR